MFIARSPHARLLVSSGAPSRSYGAQITKQRLHKYYVPTGLNNSPMLSDVGVEPDHLSLLRWQYAFLPRRVSINRRIFPFGDCSIRPVNADCLDRSCAAQSPEYARVVRRKIAAVGSGAPPQNIIL